MFEVLLSLFFMLTSAFNVDLNISTDYNAGNYNANISNAISDNTMIDSIRPVSQLIDVPQAEYQTYKVINNSQNTQARQPRIVQKRESSQFSNGRTFKYRPSKPYHNTQPSEQGALPQQQSHRSYQPRIKSSNRTLSKHTSKLTVYDKVSRRNKRRSLRVTKYQSKIRFFKIKGCKSGLCKLTGWQ